MIKLFRTLSNDHMSNLLGDLSTYSWDLHNTLGVVESFDVYIKTFLSLYNKHFPVKHLMVKEKHKPYNYDPGDEKIY